MFAAIKQVKVERSMSRASVASEMRAQAEGLHTSVDGHKPPIAVSTQ